MDFSPKLNFAKGPFATTWQGVATSREFTEAASAAMLQMQANLGNPKNFDHASSIAYQMDGARIFLAILMNLTTPPQEAPAITKTHNLDHTL